MSIKSPFPLSDVAPDITHFPRELNLNILTYLRATDLSALQRTSRVFNNRDLIAAVVDHCANVVVSCCLWSIVVHQYEFLVHPLSLPDKYYPSHLLTLLFSSQYPSELTDGFDTPIVSGEVRSVDVAVKKGTRKSCNGQLLLTTSAPTPEEKVYTYEMLRNMEMLVVARVLSRPEPPIHERSNGFYVSKSWCRAALRWLEVQEEERKEQEERRRAAHVAKLAACGGGTPKGGGKGGKHNKNQQFGSSGKKKLSRKELKQRERRVSDSMPPWSNINVDIV